MALEISGRTVVDSGSAVLGPKDKIVTIVLNELRFSLNWIKDDGGQRVEADQIGPGKVNIRLFNADSGMGTTYTVDNAGTYMGRPLSMYLFWDSVDGPHGLTRFFSYTLSVM